MGDKLPPFFEDGVSLVMRNLQIYT